MLGVVDNSILLLPGLEQPFEVRRSLGSNCMDNQHERDVARGVARGLRAGDAAAWQTLYDTYAERMWRSVARLMGPESADVADVVQETFLAAARSARTYDPERGSLWHWLSGIARNHIALHFRKLQRWQRVQQVCVKLAAAGDNAMGADGQGVEPADVLAVSELAVLVRAALTELSADHERLLTARYLDGESVDGIASRESGSTSAVRSKLARARRAFRDAFVTIAGDAEFV